MPILKLKTRFAAASMILSLALTLPGLALAQDTADVPPTASLDDHGRHGSNHGPMPIAVLGSVFGGALWLVSTPFCVLFAPKHIMDSFDLLVVAPWRMAIGSES